MFEYMEKLHQDVMQYIFDNEKDIIAMQIPCRELLKDMLYDIMYFDDSITGCVPQNPKYIKMYNQTAYEAEQRVAGNLKLLCEACDDAGITVNELFSKEGYRGCDILIRRYILRDELDEEIDSGKFDYLLVEFDEAEMQKEAI